MKLLVGKWVLDSGYTLGTSEIGATFGGQKIKILENEITLADNALKRSPQLEAQQYRPVLQKILEEARESVAGGGTMEPYAKKIGDVLGRFRSGIIELASAKAATASLLSHWTSTRLGVYEVLGDGSPPRRWPGG